MTNLHFMGEDDARCRVKENFSLNFTSGKHGVFSLFCISGKYVTAATQPSLKTNYVEHIPA